MFSKDTYCLQIRYISSKDLAFFRNVSQDHHRGLAKEPKTTAYAYTFTETESIALIFIRKQEMQTIHPSLSVFHVKHSYFYWYEPLYFVSYTVYKSAFVTLIPKQSVCFNSLTF